MTDREAILRELAKKEVVYTLPGMDAVTVQRDVTYQADGDGPLALDVYRPPQTTPSKQSPVVVIVMGYPDTTGFYRRMGWATSWGRLLAVSGIAAVIYATREPAADVHAVLRYLQPNAEALGLDAHRIGILACSGNVPVALSSLIGASPVTCAALLYGFTLDLDGSTAVADLAKAVGFVNACAGRSVDDLANDVPLIIVRAGRDQFAGLNDALDRFVARALARNLPVTVVNHATGPHAFDLDDDSEASRDIVRQVLSFFRFHLRG
jgi:dienelactone hydrolase